jgi:hypothetical protein
LLQRILRSAHRRQCGEGRHLWSPSGCSQPR